MALVNKGKKLLQCEVCDYRSSQASNIKRHIVSVHEGKKAFKCEVCDYSSS